MPAMGARDTFQQRQCGRFHQRGLFTGNIEGVWLAIPNSGYVLWYTRVARATFDPAFIREFENSSDSQLVGGNRHV